MDLTQLIIGAAMSVPRARGPELTAQSLSFTQQQQFAIFYREQSVGKLIADLIVENKAVVENKVATAICDIHIAQTLSYHCISGLQVGLILNFKTASLTFKRVANVDPQNP